MKESKRMSSIARRINIRFWFKHFGDTVGLDLCIAVALTVSWFYWKGYITLRVWEIPVEQLMEYVLWLEQYVKIPAIVIGCIQGLNLFTSLFNTNEIRRDLKPLNDLAIKAESISRINLNDLNDPITGRGPQKAPEPKFDENGNKKRLEDLGHAIDSITPDALEKGIHTGDRDMQSIEVALNNLLLRMRENQKQQARFVSDASHELRTPIAVIQGYVNMLDRWGKTDEAVLTESIEALKNESEHMKTLVEQLLFLARGDSGRNTLNKVDFDLNDVVKDVWEESMMIDAKHEYVFEERPGTVMNGDVAMVKQSLRIFIQNASKYSAENDTIKLKVFEKDGRPAYIVQDEGIGMQESDVAHIFERFYRSDSVRNSQTGGTGLGLSIAKWIVDAHNGNIEVLSRPEFGTRFTVSFQNTREDDRTDGKS